MRFTKLISLILASVLLACALCACGSDNSEKPGGYPGGDEHSKDKVTEDAEKNEENDEKKEVFRGKINSVDVSDDIIVAVKEDGTAAVVGGNTLTNNLNVANWKDIIAVSAGNSHILGLKKDGTVIASGNHENGKTNVGAWSDIVAIHAGLNQSFGLKSDGTVVMTTQTKGDFPIEGWKDIVSIAGCGDYLWGLTESGDVYVRSKASPVYSGVKSIHTNAAYALFVLENGTVVVDPFGEDYSRYYTGIEEWTDIVDVATFVYNHAIGLRSDGTVVAVGQNKDGQGDVSEWTDIVAIATGSYHTVGLRSDGTVIAAGTNAYGQCDLSEWTDIVAIYASNILTVGLKEDGTIVAAGQVWNGLDGIEYVKDVVTK